MSIKVLVRQQAILNHSVSMLDQLIRDFIKEQSSNPAFAQILILFDCFQASIIACLKCFIYFVKRQFLSLFSLILKFFDALIFKVASQELLNLRFIQFFPFNTSYQYKQFFWKTICEDVQNQTSLLHFLLESQVIRHKFYRAWHSKREAVF